jgi:hypothetical protein
MAFGQQQGPPATARQLQELTSLVHSAGHEGLREARHPLGLSQRQAAGRFTRDEADELISRLQGNDVLVAEPVAAESHRLSAAQQVLRVMTSEQLATELERRGWTVIGP